VSVYSELGTADGVCVCVCGTLVFFHRYFEKHSSNRLIHQNKRVSKKYKSTIPQQLKSVLSTSNYVKREKTLSGKGLWAWLLAHFVNWNQLCRKLQSFWKIYIDTIVCVVFGLKETKTNRMLSYPTGMCSTAPSSEFSKEGIGKDQLSDGLNQ
jgi:hypothetical protein